MIKNTIDVKTRNTVERIEAILNIDLFQSSSATGGDGAGKSGGGYTSILRTSSIQATASMLTSHFSKRQHKPDGTVSGSNTNNNSAGGAGSASSVSSTSTATLPPVSTFVSVRELANTLIAAIYEQSLEIYALQKVLIKKEDSATHKKFIDVLVESVSQLGGAGSKQYFQDTSNSSEADKKYLEKTKYYFSRKNVVALFWDHLNSFLVDIAHEKLKQNAQVCIDLLPHLLKFSEETEIAILV